MRRVAAIVLPELACELARRRADVSGPLGVIIDGQGVDEATLATAVLDVVDSEARQLGVRPGQKVVEAAALVAHLAVHRVSLVEIEAALGQVAEVALAFGATVATRLAEEGGSARRREPWDAPLDTVWVDITGSAHLVGGEDALLEQLCERVQALGHRPHAAIAGGPRIAQALARWSRSAKAPPPRRARGSKDGVTEIAPRRIPGRFPIAADGQGAIAMAPLPVQALPVEPEVARFLGQLGVITVGDLARLPSASVAPRLGARAAEVMALVRGCDDAPLCAYQPPRELVEEAQFEEGVENTESLLFVLRGMTSRMGMRLASRGESCARMELTIEYDRSIARLRQAERGKGEGDPSLKLVIELPSPLADPADLLRTLRAKLERTELAAPAVGIRLMLSQITEARRVQLDLSRDVAVDPERLPALLAELSAEIGPDRIGTLEIVDAHRPESRSRLVPAGSARSGASGARASSASPQKLAGPGEAAAGETASGETALGEPTRILPAPVSIGRVQKGAVVVIDGHEYVIERLRFEMRLHAVEWWTTSPVARDYARAWLVAKPAAQRPGLKGRRPPGITGSGGSAGLTGADDASGGARPCGEAWLYVDRATGEGFLQGWSE